MHSEAFDREDGAPKSRTLFCKGSVGLSWPTRLLCLAKAPFVKVVRGIECRRMCGNESLRSVGRWAHNCGGAECLSRAAERWQLSERAKDGRRRVGGGWIVLILA